MFEYKNRCTRKDDEGLILLAILQHLTTIQQNYIEKLKIYDMEHKNEQKNRVIEFEHPQTNVRVFDVRHDHVIGFDRNIILKIVKENYNPEITSNQKQKKKLKIFQKDDIDNDDTQYNYNMDEIEQRLFELFVIDRYGHIILKNVFFIFVIIYL